MQNFPNICPDRNFYFLSVSLAELAEHHGKMLPLLKGGMSCVKTPALWERNVSEGTIQMTPFYFGGQNCFIPKIPEVIQSPSSCPRPSCKYSIYKCLGRAHSHQELFWMSTPAFCFLARDYTSYPTAHKDYVLKIGKYESDFQERDLPLLWDPKEQSQPLGVDGCWGN